MFDVGDAMNLPYDDGSLDACRAETLLQHLTDPHQAVHEMTRVTTQVIPQRPADDAVQA